MRSICRNALVVLAASLAVAGVSASAAFATPEWYAKTGGVFTKVTSPLGFTMKAPKLELVLPGVGPFGETGTVTCKNIVVEGTVGSGDAGKWNEFRGQSALGEGCGGNIHTLCDEGIKYEVTEFPVLTELYLEGSQIRQKLLPNGKVLPEFEFECRASLIKCALAPTSMHLTNNAEGNVEAAYDEKSAAVSCNTKSGKGEWKGVFTIEHPKGTEAIKVE